MNDAITFSTTTPRLGLPNLFPGQAQKEFFVNEALGMLDGLLHLSIEGFQSIPPAAPEVSQSWIVDENATDDWSGHEASVAIWTAGGWTMIEPTEGMAAFNKATQQFVVFKGSWMEIASPAQPQGGATIDVEARAAIGELIAALRSFGVFPGT